MEPLRPGQLVVAVYGDNWCGALEPCWSRVLHTNSMQSQVGSTLLMYGSGCEGGRCREFGRQQSSVQLRGRAATQAPCERCRVCMSRMQGRALAACAAAMAAKATLHGLLRRRAAPATHLGPAAAAPLLDGRAPPACRSQV